VTNLANSICTFCQEKPAGKQFPAGFFHLKTSSLQAAAESLFYGLLAFSLWPLAVPNG
jgi:hypothetical protein